MDRITGGDGPVLLCAAAWQESQIVEHKCVPQSKALCYTGKKTIALSYHSIDWRELKS